MLVYYWYSSLTVNLSIVIITWIIIINITHHINDIIIIIIIIIIIMNMNMNMNMNRIILIII